MKRYIRAMGMERGSAKLHIECYKKCIAEHIIKCIIYGDSLSCYDHWVDEISAWFYDINNTQLKIKRNPPKFKDFEYKDMAFGLLGTTTTDSSGALTAFKANNTDYPDFEITRSLVLSLYGASGDLEDHFCTLFASSRGKMDTSLEDIRSQVHFVLDDYIR